MPALLAAAVALGVAALLVVPAPDGDHGTAVDRSAPGGAQNAPSADRAPELFGGSAVGSTAGGSGAAQAGGTADVATADDDKRVVRTGSLSLVVDDGKVPATVSRVVAVVTGARGYVSASTSEEAGERPVATLTARVPVEAFEQVLARVRAVGAKVVSAETGGRDVTATYADTKAQIQSLQAARARFLTILAGARTISETLTVQQRVDDVQKQIDRLEAQRRVLADSSDLATITVTVAEESDEVLVVEAPSGWEQAWDDAQDGFVGGLQDMLARSGRLLLVLLVAAVLFAPARAVVRRVRRRVGNAEAEGAAPIA